MSSASLASPLSVDSPQRDPKHTAHAQSRVGGVPTVCPPHTHAVTHAQVGYGDFSPSRWYSQLFTVAYALFGIVVVFSKLSASLQKASQPLFDWTRKQARGQSGHALTPSHRCMRALPSHHTYHVPRIPTPRHSLGVLAHRLNVCCRRRSRSTSTATAAPISSRLARPSTSTSPTWWGPSAWYSSCNSSSPPPSSPCESRRTAHTHTHASSPPHASPRASACLTCAPRGSMTERGGPTASQSTTA